MPLRRLDRRRARSRSARSGSCPEIDRYTTRRPPLPALDQPRGRDGREAPRELVPVASRTPVARVMAAARRHALSRRDRVMLSYVCISGRNVSRRRRPGARRADRRHAGPPRPHRRHRPHRTVLCPRPTDEMSSSSGTPSARSRRPAGRPSILGREGHPGRLRHPGGGNGVVTNHGSWPDRDESRAIRVRDRWDGRSGGWRRQDSDRRSSLLSLRGQTSRLEATILLKALQPTGAVYLAGYVVECMLKSLMYRDAAYRSISEEDELEELKRIGHNLTRLYSSFTDIDGGSPPASDRPPVRLTLVEPMVFGNSLQSERDQDGGSLQIPQGGRRDLSMGGWEDSEMSITIRGRQRRRTLDS